MQNTGIRIVATTDQGVSSLVLVECSDPGPVELLEEGEAGLVELVLGGHHPEEVREAGGREHRMCVRVRNLENIVIAFSKFRSSSQMPLPDYKNAFALKLIIPLEVVIRIF